MPKSGSTADTKRSVAQSQTVLATVKGRGVASYGTLGHVSPRLPTILFLIDSGVNLRANYPSIV